VYVFAAGDRLRPTKEVERGGGWVSPDGGCIWKQV